MSEEHFDKRYIREKYPEAFSYLQKSRYMLAGVILVVFPVSLLVIAAGNFLAQETQIYFVILCFAAMFWLMAAAAYFEMAFMRSMNMQELRESGRYVIPVMRGHFEGATMRWKPCTYSYTARRASYLIRQAVFAAVFLVTLSGAVFLTFFLL
ncbi:MAG: hypothetical protein EA357_00885 [Micavibrio sp.]|nr:MAG: hypothetical protein EA357_00885 [Micavibrio sp.]